MRLILAVLLMLASTAVNADDEIYEQMGRYFSDFNEGVTADTLIEEYFEDEIFVLSPSGTHFYKTRHETANWLGSVLEAIRKEGWLESILRSHSVCMIGD